MGSRAVTHACMAVSGVTCGSTCVHGGQWAHVWWNMRARRSGGLTCGGICMHGGQVGSRAVAHACMAVRWAHAWPWVAHAVAYA